MKNKKIFFLVSSCLFLCASCNPKPHEHTWSSDWETNETQHWRTCSGCEEKGNLGDHVDSNHDEKCDVCDYNMPHVHNWSSEWTSNESKHWKTCSGCDEKKDEGDHIDSDGDNVCDVCEYEMPEPIDVSGYIKSQAYVHDGSPHKIEITGLPEGAEVSYTDNDEQTDVGIYPVTVSITGDNIVDVEQEVHLIIYDEADVDAVIDDFEKVSTNNDLADMYETKFYKDDGWTESTNGYVKLSGDVPDTPDNTKSMLLHASHQGSPYKYTRQDYVIGSETYETFKSFSFDAKKNVSSGTQKLQIQVWLEGLKLPAAYSEYDKFYATYTVTDDLSSDWTHFNVPLDDEGWVFNSTQGMTPSVVEEVLGLNMEQLSLYMTDFCILLNPQYVEGGAGCSALIDNITKSFEVDDEKEIPYEFNIFGRKYVAESPNGIVFTVETGSETENTAWFTTRNLPTNLGTSGTVTLDGNDFKFDYASTITLEGTLSEGKIELTNAVLPSQYDPQGELVEDLKASTLEEVVVIDDFEHYSETGVGYDATHSASQRSGLRGAYYSDYYSGNQTNPSPVGGNGWSLMGSTDYLNLSTNSQGHSKGENRPIGYAGDFKVSNNQMRYMTYALSDGIGKTYGKAKHLSLWAKAASALTGVKIRVAYVDQITPSTQGTFDMTEVTVDIGTDYQQIVIDLNPNKNVYGLVIVPNKPSSAVRLLIDDIELYNDVNPWEAYEEPHINVLEDGKYYVNSGWYHLLEVNGSTATYSAKEDTTEYSQMVPPNYTVAQSDSVITITSSTNTFEIVGDVLDDAKSFTVTAVNSLNPAADILAGAMAQYLVGKTFKAYDSINLDFEDGTSESAYSNTHWKQEKYGETSWTEVSNKMNCRSGSNGNTTKFVNMYCNSSSFRYTYTPDVCSGPVNNISLRLSTHFTNNAIKAKLKLIDTLGGEHYIFGDGNNWVTIPAKIGSSNFVNLTDLEASAGTTWHSFDTIVAKQIVFVVQSTTSEDNYFYIDDVVLSYVQPA